MKIAFNPSTVAALTSPPDNKDITFDLRGRNIFARGVKFYGTDTWRPVVDNLTSNSATSSLSANQGRVLAGLINGKSDSDHNHDGRYIRKSGDTMLGALNFANGTWNLVGDDSYMGDCNISGHFGIKAANTTYPGIAFFNKTGNHLGNLTAYSGNIKYGAYSLQFLDNGNTSVSASTWTNPFSAYNSNAVADGQAICVWGQNSYLSNLSTDTGDMSLWLKRVNAHVATLNMVLDGEYYANGNQRLAHVSEIPTSLKNPYALTISLNGTSQGPYDGSAAKNINITPSSIGAATSDHNHDGRYVYNYGGTQMDGASVGKNALGMTTNSGVTGDWWHILQAAWNGEYRWNSQIAFPTQNRNGMYYRSGLDDNTKWGSWVKLLDTNNYSGVLDSRYYTESEVNSLLDAKLNRQNLSYGTWNPRGYNLAADYFYNGGDLSISESGGQIHVSVDGYFWQNEGRYRVLDTSDVAGLKGDLTVHQYLSNTDVTWWPLIWGGSSHANTSDSTGAVYKSHDKLSWQTSSQTLYATHLRTTYIDLENSRGISQVTSKGTSPYKGIRLPDLQSNGIGMFSKLGDGNGADEGGIIISADTSVIYNSFDTGWGLSVRDKDRGQTDISGDGTIAFGVRQDYRAYSLGGFEKSGSNNSYVLLGGGGHKLESSLNVANANTISGYDIDHLLVKRGRLGDYNIDHETTFGTRDIQPSSEVTISGKKPFNGWGTLLVIGSIDGASNHQLAFTGDNRMFIRCAYGTSNNYNTKDWATVALTSDNVASASKLLTTRSIWGQSFDGTRDVNGTIYINNSNSSEGAIRLNNNINSNARISAIDNKIIFNTGGEIRFGETDWNYDRWAGLKYTYSNKTIYLGIADGSEFTALSPKSNGTLKLPGITTITTNPGARIGNSGGDLYLGNANNNGWVKVQDICSHNGSDYWYIYQSGNAIFNYIKSKTNAYIVGNLEAGQIIRGGSSQMWVNGRNGALLRETSVAGYHALWSLKTTNGSWDFGEYNAGSDWNNIPVLSYITDSNYNSGNNAPTYQIKFPLASGTVALTSNILNPTNYYWANVKISTSSSTTTSPTVHTLTATRICAGHDPEIDNSISCSNWFRSSGNTGWYNTTYKGGIYMSDTSWIRTHHNVGIYAGQIYADSSIRMSSIRLERTNEINSSDDLFINYGSSTNVSLCNGGGNVGIGTISPTQKLDVNGNIITKGFGIQPYYLSKSVLLPTISPGDGYEYKCLEIGRTTEISCIIADKASLMNERGILIKFNKGYDGQIILLKDLQNYGSGNGYFWVMPSGCNIIKADGSSILVGQNQISNTYDDGRSRFLVYSSLHNVWIEFLCANIN